MDEHEENFQRMFLTGGLQAKARREKICGTAVAPGHIAGRFHADSPKALVMTYIGQRKRALINKEAVA
jgi:hypothetical protein